MTRPSRASASGRAYLDLQARARREGRPADELLTLYVLERFPYRLSVSAYRDVLGTYLTQAPVHAGRSGR